MTQTRLNAHSLLKGTPSIDGFLDRLIVPTERLGRLRSARDKLRLAIITGFASWQMFIRSETLFKAGIVRKTGTAPKLPQPKFHRQGSAGYALLNVPAHQPPQQIDFDDGMFLPTSFVASSAGNEGSRSSPIVASVGYFRLVEAILTPVCKAQGWMLKQKDCCVRVELDSHSHIDIALYAIPDDQFEMLIEKAFAVRAYAHDSDTADELPDDIYNELAEDRIMLAQRSKGWIDSDPRAIDEWFGAAIRNHGEQLRRICRYLKAWRDYQWQEKCKVTSILLMKCAVDAFDALRGTFDANRDDAALMMVASHLGRYFGDLSGVQNPVLPQVLNSNWDQRDREAYVREAANLHSQLRDAIELNDNRALAIAKIQAILGYRVPDDVSLVVPVTAESLIRSYEIKRTPEPRVTRTTSG